MTETDNLRHKILIVDDGEVGIALTRALVRNGTIDREDRDRMLAISDEKYRIHYQQKSKEAVGIARVWSPHLIITDMQMPELSGLAMMREIQKGIKLDRISHYPNFFIMSSSYNQDIEKRIEELELIGYKGFIKKPLDFPDIRIKVGKALWKP